VRILLDTHYLLWVVGEPELLPARARTWLDDADEILFSSVSIWEIAIKAGLGRKDFGVRPEVIAASAERSGYTSLPITWRDAALVAQLPHHHRNPFDRLLVAQATALPARLLTSDARLGRYSELVWVEPG